MGKSLPEVQVRMHQVRMHQVKQTIKIDTIEYADGYFSVLTRITSDLQLEEKLALTTVDIRRMLISYLFAAIIFFSTLATLPIKEKEKSAALYQIVSTLLGSFSTVVIFFFAQEEKDQKK